MTVGLVSGAAFNVDDILLAVDSGDLAFLSLEGTTKDADFVILADWNGADLMKLKQEKRERI